jgi:hypothetical protein
MNEYRINEIKYNDGSILFFAQHLRDGLFMKKWTNIGNPSGHYKIETAKIEIETHKRFYNPPKMIENKIHSVD